MHIAEAINTGTVLADGNSMLSNLQSGWGVLLILAVIFATCMAGFSQNGGIKKAVGVFILGAIIIAFFYNPNLVRTIGEMFSHIFS